MIIHSIISDVKFPDMKHYDMGKTGDMALYLAHCDFFPFKSIINSKLDTEKKTINFIWNMMTSLKCMTQFLSLWIEHLGLSHKINIK